MTAPLLLDPEIEGLLQEIAADPRSNLLKVDRPTALKTALESTPRVSVAAATLTNAERQLLSVHRAEAAWLLREACLIVLMSEQPYSSWISKGRTRRRLPQTLSASQWNVEASRLASCERSLLPASLGACLVGPSDVDVTTLASLSLRIAPAANTRNYLAIGLIAEGKHSLAAKVLLDTLAMPLTLPLTTSTINNLATCYSLAGEYQKAVSLLQWAGTLDEDEPETLMNLALNALLCDERKVFLNTARMLAMFGNRIQENLKEFEECHKRRGALHALTLHQREHAIESSLLVQKIRDAVDIG